MSIPAVTSEAPYKARQPHRLHPLPLRIMHWINAVAIFIMIGSGWKIYNDDVIFGFLHFPDWLVIGKWAQHGLQWHFFGMWIFVLNGLAYLSYGIATGRFRRKLFPISISGLALWKPVQFSELATLFGTFQTIRLVHFLCMSAIVGFILIHVSLALLVPQSPVAMV